MRYLNGQTFPLDECCPLHMPEPGAGLPEQAWHSALLAARRERASDPPEAVLERMEARQTARQQKDWHTADRLRKEILDLGWNVDDSPDGPILHPSDEPHDPR